MSEKILLIDGNSLINRAFYAMPLLTNRNGEYTNGVYGFLNIFFKLFDEENPNYCIVCFDVHQPTFRHLEYKEYKGTRKGMPAELVPQMDTLKKILHSMNIKTMEMGGYEADDLLGTIAVTAEKMGIEPIIVSGDRDLLQLASDTIKIRIPKTKSGSTIIENYNTQDVIDTYGVTPKEFIDVKALMGDTSDNVPGVPSIGEKTAAKIIQKYKTVENAIQNSSDIKPKKAGENLALYSEQAIMSKWLVTIKTDVPIIIGDFRNAGTDQMFNENSYSLFKEYEFKSMLSRFELKEEADAKTNYVISDDILSYIDGRESAGYKLFVEEGSAKALAVSCDDYDAVIVREPSEEVLNSSQCKGRYCVFTQFWH